MDIDRPLFPGRSILWIGCVVILGVMCFSTIDITLSLKRTAAKSDGMIGDFRERAHILEELRSTMIRSRTILRSHSVEADGGGAGILAARRQTDQLLNQFGNLMRSDGDSKSLTKLGDLKQSIGTYWDSLPSLVKQSSVIQQNDRDVSYQPTLDFRRAEISHLSRDITDLNNRQLDLAEAQIHSEQRRLQDKLFLSSILEICIASMLIVAITLRIKRTEQYAETQYRKVILARTELRNLAARLENAQEEERRKLSRELHDELGQAMAAILLELRRIDLESFQDDATKKRLASIQSQVEHSMRSIRDIALLLRPSMLDDLGLVPALKWQGREVARRTGLSIRVEAEETGDLLPDTYRTSIYRIVQETLHNIVEHAQATSVSVIFKRTKDNLDLRIEDDGRGFNPALEKGLGLLGIEERVARLRGHVEVISNRGSGTWISVSLPAPASGDIG